jgi:molybdopterin-guanine dinucleotide biosynthesis protein A
MSITKENINGYILAGGISSRMGTDKGMMLLNGKPMVEHVIEQLKPAVDKVVIISNNPEYEKLGLEVIPDLIKDIGPAGGIYTALKYSDTNYNFMVSCDMPFITPEAVKFMVQKAIESQIIVPVSKGQMEPMFGVYSKDCLTLWSALIEKGLLKLQELVTHFDVLKLNVDDNELFSNRLFQNINTREEFEKINLDAVRLMKRIL